MKYILSLSLLLVLTTVFWAATDLPSCYVDDIEGDVVIIKNKDEANFIEAEKVFFTEKLQARYVSCFSLYKGFLGWQCLELVQLFFKSYLNIHLSMNIAPETALNDIFCSLEAKVASWYDVNVRSTAAIMTCVLISQENLIYISHGLCRVLVFRKTISGECKIEEIKRSPLSFAWAFGCTEKIPFVKPFSDIVTYEIRPDDYMLFLATEDFFQHFSYDVLCKMLYNTGYGKSFSNKIKKSLSPLCNKDEKSIGNLGFITIPLVHTENRKIIDEIDQFILQSRYSCTCTEKAERIQYFLKKTDDCMKEHIKNKTLHMQTSGKLFALLGNAFLSLEYLVETSCPRNQICLDCMTCFCNTLEDIMGSDVFDCFSGNQQVSMKKWVYKIGQWYPTEHVIDILANV